MSKKVPDGIPKTVFNIYAGRSIADLDKRSKKFPSLKIRRLGTFRLCKCISKLLDEAVLSFEIGDLEMAYIKYMRYVMLFGFIHYRPGYRKYSEAIDRVIGSHAYQEEVLKRLEIIINSLNAKYKELADEEKRLNKTITLENPYKPDHLKGQMIGLTPMVCKRRVEYITCQELHRLITAKKAVPEEVILDCRPYNDYFTSKIIHQCCINVDEEIIERGVTIGLIESYFKPETVAFTVWQSRTAAENVILYDWHTNTDRPITDTPLEILKDVLHTWDTNANYKSLKFLKGGFAEFIKLYPKLTTNPDVVVPPPKCIPINTPADDVEYGNVEEIIMKEETFSVGVKNISVINDEATPESVKKFNVKTLKEKVIASEKLADKSVLLTEELLNAEQALKYAIIATESATDENTKQKENEKVIELEYEVLQLENTSHDLAEDFHILFDEVVAEKELLPDAIPTEVLQEIEKKDCKLQKLTEMTEQVAHEKRLSETREVIPPSPVKIPPVDKLDKSISLLTEVLRELTPTKAKPTVIVPRGLTGLKNLGVTCYMNTIIQCLSNTNALTEYFINRVYARHIEPGTSPLVESLAVVIRSLWCGKFDTITPHQFYIEIGKRYEPFSEERMEDSQELLVLLIEWLHNDLAKPASKPVYHENANIAEKNWSDFIARQPSDIIGVFYGQFKTIVKCEKCNFEMSRFEQFTMINLIIPPGDGRFELTQCLDLFFNGETIQYNCPQCFEKGECSGQAVQKLNITRLPPYLIIHLKRFNNDLTKKRNKINFPLEDLKLDAYIAPSEAGSGKKTVTGSYHLYAITNHYGTLTGGHYTAFCKNSMSKRWYKCDDSRILTKDASDVDSSAAYILFYTKLELTAPPEVHLVE